MGRHFECTCQKRLILIQNNIFLTILSLSFVCVLSPLRLTAVSSTKQACKYTKCPMKSLIPLRTTDFAGLLWLSEHYVKRTFGRCCILVSTLSSCPHFELWNYLWIGIKCIVKSFNGENAVFPTFLQRHFIIESITYRYQGCHQNVTQTGSP
jgi:hypothetical protein